jgi:hypothetical protein
MFCFPQILILNIRSMEELTDRLENIRLQKAKTEVIIK